MSYQRNKAQEAMLKLLEELTDGKENSEMYKQIFNRMSDTEFTTWMEKMAKEQEWMFLVAPPYNREFLDFERTIKLLNDLQKLESLNESIELSVQDLASLGIKINVTNGGFQVLPVAERLTVRELENAKLDALDGGYYVYDRTNN